ncbi:MAG: hypothetical protein ABI136_01025 [Ginsengibacter sp.]
MKRLISISFFSILILLKLSAFSQGQSAYYDAKFIYDQCFDKDDGVFKNKASLYDLLLKKYYPFDNALSELKLKENPFFSPFVPAAIAQSITTSNFKDVGGSFFNNLDVTNIADGLAQFLIKRGREELNVAFFNQLKEFLNNPKNEECKVLFPETVNLLGKIDSYKYAAFLENLRTAFHTDLDNLIIHLNQVIDLPKYETLIANHSEIKLVLGTANIVSELSQAGKSIKPDSVIKQLAVLPWGSVSKNLENSLKFLNLISQSIRAQSDTSHQSWVSLSDLNTHLFTNIITLRIYFGLLYQQVKSQNITFYSKKGDSIRMDELLAAQKDNIFRLSGLIQNFSLLADEVQNTIGDYEAKKEKGTLTNDDNYTYISKAINIINYGFTVVPTTFKIPDGLNADIINDRYIAVARNANELYKNIYTKNYNSAVLNVCEILDSLLPDKKDKKLIPGILKYGNFMASVVKAESPEEVQSAIEASALPAGSSSIKKNSAFNISLNAYIGGYFGRVNSNLNDIDGNNSKVGVTAPVGVAFSLGLGHFKNGSSLGSLSLYGTLIDVGAIAGYRLNNDSTALDQKVTLGDIFTPGGYLVYGIGLPFKWLSYVPLSIGYGWQYGSKLYDRKDGKIDISTSSRWRSNWFVAIDIPLANFWTKNYKK